MSSRLPDLPQQGGTLSHRDLQVSQAERDTFADLLDGGGIASDLLTIRTGGLDAEGIEAGLRLGNLLWQTLHGGTTKGND